MIDLAPLASIPLAVDWPAAGRVAGVGFAGVFLVLALLYGTMLLYGAVARWIGRSGGAGGDER